MSHVTPILHLPALLYPFNGEVSNSIPSPVKQIQAQQSKHIANDDEDEWEVIAEYTTNHQHKQSMLMRLLMTFTDILKFLCTRGASREGQTLTLETIRVHVRHSHKGVKMHARKSAPGVRGFLAQREGPAQ